jgi:hypothetical protein
MKKFILLFILLLALGGCGFYFGWVQIEIPAGSKAVIFTKTQGWENTILEPGVFTWRWEKLIPRNFTLYLYPDKTYTEEIKSEGSLPSADVYNLFLEGRPDFRYSLSFSLTYRIKDDFFPVLARDNGVLPEGLDEWLASVRAGIGTKCSAAIVSWFETAGNAPLPPGTAEKEITGAMSRAIAADYPFLEVISAAPTQILMPDTALYAKGREIYLAQADSKKEAIRQNAQNVMNRTLQEDGRMETLKKYGELLTQYPVLMDFLKIEKSLAEP